MASHQRHVLLLFCTLALFLGHASALTQTYCSGQNTGSANLQDTYTYQSNGHCSEECSGDYAFAIVQGQSCWCSNYAPSDQQDVSNCDTTCPGYGYENCGSTADDLYGYLKLDLSASGTVAASSSVATSTTTTAQTSTSSAAQPSSSAQATTIIPDPETVYQTVTKSSVIVSLITPTETSTSSSSSSESSTSSSTTSTSSTEESTSEDSSSSSSKTTTPVTQVTVVTVGGSVVTQTVTSMPTSADGNSGSGTSSKSVSGGQIAGAVIGGLAGFALVTGAIVWLLLRRRRRDEQQAKDAEGSPDGGATPQRNVSTLSRTGLLRSTEKDYTATLPPINTRNSSHDPSDSITPLSERRNSRPIFHDQRLNPTPFMDLDNGSHASIISIEDNRDYTRTLNVRNPDPPEQASFGKRDSWDP